MKIEECIQQLIQEAPAEAVLDAVEDTLASAQPEAPKAEPHRECVSLLADLEAGKPVGREAAATIRRLIDERDAAPKVEQEPDGYLTNVYATLVGCDWWEITKEPYELKSFEKIREVHALYRHPAPASDELLEALKRADAAIGGADISKIRHSEGGVDLAKKVVDLKAASQNLIAKHKGPQS